MNLDDLKIIRNDERRSRRLTSLKTSFYLELRQYLKSLRESNDPQKSDEFENAMQVAEAIYDKRAAKIIKLAALAAKGHREDALLAEEELQIFDTVFDVFTRCKNHMLALRNEGLSDTMQFQAPAPGDKKGELIDTKLHLESGYVGKGGTISNAKKGRKTQYYKNSKKGVEHLNSESETPPDTHSNNTRTLIREDRNIKYIRVQILEDIPTFVGLDGENYKLSKSDVILLPEGNAKTLAYRKMAIIVGDKLENA